MGVTMFIQQRMTPSTAIRAAEGDADHAGHDDGHVPVGASGLVIYWTVSNLWGIGQQMITNKLIGPAVVRTMRAAGGAAREERRRRQDRPGQGAIDDRAAKARGLVKQRVSAMGLTLDVQVVDTPDAIRFEISGDGGEVLLKRKGEALDALQQIVNTGFRRELDDDRSSSWTAWLSQGQDDELKQMTRFTMEKASSRVRRKWVR
jgi:predicted RNA-binding protein Jag